MIYRPNDPYLPGMADDYITGGADPLRDDVPERCCMCGSVIRHGDMYYDVSGRLYCMDCSDAGDSAVLEAEREKYMWEME